VLILIVWLFSPVESTKAQNQLCRKDGERQEEEKVDGTCSKVRELLEVVCIPGLLWESQMERDH
jgi:hypothetical protein